MRVFSHVTRVCIVASYCLFFCASAAMSQVPDDFVSNRIKPLVILENGCGQNTKDSYLASNTLPCCIAGLQQADGIALQLQMTADNRIVSISATDDTTMKILAKNTFAQVESLIAASSLAAVTLEHVLSYYKRHDYQNVISFSISKKTLKSRGGFFGNRKAISHSVCKQLHDLSVMFAVDSTLFIESDDVKFLQVVASQIPGATCVLVAGADVKKALAKAVGSNISILSVGLSELYSLPRCVDNIHYKEKKIKVTGVETKESLDKVLLERPDYIQTNNFDYKAFLN